MGRADELSFEITRAALTQISPDDVALLDALGLDFIEAASAPRARDGALGFDVGQVTLAAATASAAFVVSEFVKECLAESVKSIAAEVAAPPLKRLVSRYRRRRGAPTDDDTGPEVTLSDEEIAEVRRRAVAHAQALGLGDDQARLLADALAGSLSAPD